MAMSVPSSPRGLQTPERGIEISQKQRSASVASQARDYKNEDEHEPSTRSTSSLIRMYETNGGTQAGGKEMKSRARFESTSAIFKSGIPAVILQDDKGRTAATQTEREPCSTTAAAHQSEYPPKAVSELDTFLNGNQAASVDRRNSRTTTQSTLAKRRSSSDEARTNEDHMSAARRDATHGVSEHKNLQVSTYTDAEVDKLANAIVASSLASSRQASPSALTFKARAPPLPPLRRSLFHHGKEEHPRTPSPPKLPGLRSTLRTPRMESEEEVKTRGKKRLLGKKHPNKHNEGSRKRWRDEVTPKEKKRYEAVWASNRGLYTTAITKPGTDDRVCNLVARDIYQRSGLSNDVLEEVYALIARKTYVYLEKEEFVVGMWLVDQQLKGRKLPGKVSNSVWRSVGVLGGLKVRDGK